MNRKKIGVYIVAFLLPILLYSILCMLKGIYPFGDFSNLIYDLEIQYADFYAYYRQVLLGQAEISYSFVKSLGGSLVALWGYYLASPLNLLVVFFRPEQMQLFVFIITAIKIGLCGLTLAVFVKSKYTNMQGIMVVFLSVAYSFTQYVVGQMSNLNWLDGVFLLPLILLGIDKYIYEKKKIYFYIFLALSIIFNWYTGYMNCIFAVLYFVYQFTITEIFQGAIFSFKKYVKEFISFIWLELLSVLLSLCIFLPVMLGQSSGRSTFDEGIFKFETNGSLLNILRGFMIGSNNPSKVITLFCSIFLLLLLAYYIVDKCISRAEKNVSFIFLAIMVCSLFFAPLEHIWVGFKFENSYAYRFLYLAIMVVILMCARVLEHIGQVDQKLLVRVLGVVIFILLALDMLQPFDSKRLWFEIIVLIVYVALLIVRKKKVCIRITGILLSIFFVTEIIVNARLVVAERYSYKSTDYVEYVSQEAKLLEQVSADEADFHRIEKTLNRDKNLRHNSFYANESMTYLYSGIQQYISSYDSKTANIIKNLGYSRGDFPSFYHDPILPADSLLGVKYVLTERQYDGFELQDEFDSYNDKSVYENPYALPLGFTINGDMRSVTASENPFEYMNDIYSGILGKKVQLLQQIVPSSVKTNETGINYSFSSVDENTILYARINGDNLNLNIGLNTSDETQPYRTGWLNHNVVVLGSMEKECYLYIQDHLEDDLDILFYMVKLNDLETVTGEIKEGGIQNLVVDEDYVEFEATGEKVMLTIPYDEAWRVQVNGKSVETQEGADAFMVLPLDEGEVNTVTMEYHIKGKSVGMALSITSIVIFVLWAIKDKRQRRI